MVVIATPQKKCFVLMPFTVKEIDQPRYRDMNHWNEVYAGLIAPAVESTGVLCDRDDQDVGSRLIVENILVKIEEADIVLCDLSSHNPNVFLELGWALRTDKPFILIKDDLTTFTFDLNQQYTFQYGHSLQPTQLRKEINDLSGVVSRTLADTERRYSLVKKMSISISAIETLKGGDAQSQILMDIHRRILNMQDFRGLEKSQVDLFPWPTFLRQGMRILYQIKNDLANLEELIQEDIVKLLDEKATFMGIRRNQIFQFSVLDESRKFIYHDMENMIGLSASCAGLDGYEIYDDIYQYPQGVVAWVDRATNIPRNLPPTHTRLNIALFSVIDKSKWKLVVEIHLEKS